MKNDKLQVLQYMVERSDEIGRVNPNQKFRILEKEVLDKFDFILSGPKRMSNLIAEGRKIIGEMKDRIDETENEMYIEEGEGYETFEKDTKSVLSRLSDHFKDDKIEVRKSPTGKVFVPFIYKMMTKEGIETSHEELIESVLLDRVLFCYSRYGQNMTEQEVVDTFGISGKLWNAIKSKLNITKLSSLVSDITLDNSENPSELIEEATTKGLDAKYRKQFADSKIRQQETLLKKYSKKIFNIEETFASFERTLERYIPLELNPVIVNENQSDKIAMVTITDEHLGKMGTEFILGDVIPAMIVQTVKYLRGQGINRIKLVHGGDGHESLVQDGQKEGQKYTMSPEYAHKSADEMVMVFNDMIEYIVSEFSKNGIYVEHYFHISGNHPRTSQNLQGDKDMAMDALGVRFLSKVLEKYNVKTTHLKDQYHAIELGDNTVVALAHGHEGRKMSIGEVALKYGQPGKNLIIQIGHEHAGRWKEESEHVEFLVVPSLAGQGDYDMREGYTGKAGFAIVHENDYGSHDIHIGRLPTYKIPGKTKF